jgi:magnesium chelatase subunit D
MSHHLKKPLLPFSAIVGQELMKKALLLNAINPTIGGVLIRGEKGTAKSSAVRALAEILPTLQVVPGCPFSCDPERTEELCEICTGKKESNHLPAPVQRRIRVVNLPVGATEDRVIGTIDIERALREGIKALDPGILADANRGILYIDEVNLLDDHVVDVLLDAAAMGVSTVEREGISFSHPARFILIGTMNPEEGELRPQLLDRFGLQVSVEALDNPEDRIAIVMAAEEHLADPARFRSKFDTLQQNLSKRIQTAISLLPTVRISGDLIRKAVDVCIELGVRTHRAEITIVRTAKTIAALDGRTEVTREDLKEAIELALPHRMRKRPFEEPKIDHDRLDDLMDDPDQSPEKQNDPRDTPDDTSRENSPPGQDENQGSDTPPRGSGGTSQEERVFGVGSPIDTGKIQFTHQTSLDERYAPGRRFDTTGDDRRGHYTGTYQHPDRNDFALDATIRSVAPYQKSRHSDSLAVVIKSDELLIKKRVGKTATACLFVVDASGSMGVEHRMEAAKGAVFSLLEDSYKYRDRVGMIAFRGDSADLVLPLSSSIDLAYNRLRDLPTGGRTPLVVGLQKALSTFMNEKRKYPSLVPILILITDGRANVGRKGSLKADVAAAADDLAQAGIQTLVIDTEQKKKGGFGFKLGFCQLIAEHTRGLYYRMSDLTSERVSGMVKAGVSGLMA